MNDKQALKALYAIETLNEPNLIFGSKKGTSENEPFFVRRLVAAEDLNVELARRVLTRVDELSKVASPQQLRGYDAGYMADEDEPRVIKLAEDVVIADVYNSIGESTASIDPFKKEERGNGRLSYYCLQAFDDDGVEIRFYRAMSPGKQLKPTRSIQAFYKNNKFVAAEETPLVFDPHFTCATYHGYIFIFGTAGFETLFQYFQELRRHAEETLDEVNAAHLPIDDYTKFKDVVLGNKANIKRLRGITKRGHLKNYSVATISETIKKFKLNIKVSKGTGGKPHLHWADGQEQEVLRLLDDYYLTSTTSQFQYGSNSKEIYAS